MTDSGKPPAPIEEVLSRLAKVFGDAHTALNHKNSLELLVATILSAQCTDKRVNEVTPVLFSKYRSAKDFAEASPSELELIVRPTGFFRQKTKSLIGLGQRLESGFGGEVPPRMDDLVTLPGVGRKTANIVLGEAYGINDGVAVDTHVKRVSFRLGLTTHKDPLTIEQDLMGLAPRERWTQLSHFLIFHGRKVCIARKPKCGECVLNDICPSAFTW